MIPKILHLCWMSEDPYPDKIQKCLDSWKNVLPDYEIKLWNSKTFDVNISKWTKQAFEMKQYAFVADYVRFYALFNYGGIYLDSDVEVIKKFDNLLLYKYFFCYEYTALPEAAVVASEPGLEWLNYCVQFYNKNEFLDSNGIPKRIIAPLILKQGFESKYKIKLIDFEKKEVIDNGIVLPYDYFSVKNGFTGKLKITDNTYSIHHFNSSWLKKNKLTKIKKYVHVLLILLFGKKKYNKIIYIIRNRKKNYI